MKIALRMEGIRKRFGRRTALDGLDLEVPSDAAVGLVGENGAGKTTTFSIALGYLRASGGRIDILGEGPFDPARHRGRVALLPQDAAVPADALPLHWLSYLAELQGMPRRNAREQARDLLDELHLADRALSPMRTLSHGMRKRIMLAQALIGEPELILLDEPFSGIDPREAETISALLARKKGGRALLISSHDLAQIERTCDRVIFVHRGKVTREMTLDSLATAHRGRIGYRLTREPDRQPLAQALPGASFEWNPKNGELTCLLPPDAADLASVNRAVLTALLEQNVDILAVDPGSRIEAAYFGLKE